MVVGVGRWIVDRKCSPKIKPVNSQMRSVVDAKQIMKQEFKKGSNWMLMFAFGFVNAAFFLQYMKWNHIVNQFCFTQVNFDIVNIVSRVTLSSSITCSSLEH